MPLYTIEVSIGGSAIVQVEAPSEDKAVELAELYTINDWEEAGPMRLGDAHIDNIIEGPAPGHFDASIIDTGESTWRLAPDDPAYDEEDDEAAVPAGD